MSYYETIDDDLKRAKEILAKGENAVYGGDSFTAYKLLASFVAEIERLRAQLVVVEAESDAAGQGWAECIELNKLEIERLRLVVKVDEQTLTHQQAIIDRLRALVDAVGEKVCEMALRVKGKSQ